MDPANRSLIEAMRITYRLLMIGMVALLGVYVLSGFQPIDEGQRGVRTLFGRIDAADLPSGVQFAFPPPFGGIVKVPTGTQTIKIETEFFPNLREQDRGKPVNEIAPRGRNSLDPAVDGAMITADRNLAHARWEVVYRRTDPKKLLESVLPDDQERIIRAMVKRAIVRVVSEVPIDDLLKQAQGDEGSVVNRARRLAQTSLDSVLIDGEPGLGIEIERIDLLDKVPPLTLMDEFAAVQSAQATANQRVEQARAEAQSSLNRTAGRAATVLIELIDDYERGIEIESDEDAEFALGAIRSVMLGESVELPSDEGPRQIPERFVSGEVVRILDEADVEGEAIVSRARTSKVEFDAKIASIESNPLVTKQRAWALAYARVLESPTLQTMMVPPGTSLVEVLINQDPQIKRDLELAQKRAEIEQANRERREELRSERTQLRSKQESPDS